MTIKNTVLYQVPQWAASFAGILPFYGNPKLFIICTQIVVSVEWDSLWWGDKPCIFLYESNIFAKQLC